MNNKLFYDAFKPICATDGLKQNINVYIHSEVVKRQCKTYTLMRYALSCCAVLVVMVSGISGYHFYQTPVSYISVDVNPSVELSLNRLDRVVSATAYNDDGVLILQNLNLKNKPYIQAVELLLSDQTFANYLSDDYLLSFAVISDKEDELLAGIQQCKGFAQNNAECHSVNADNMESAHHNGLSFGKYQAYLELAEYDRTITPEECKQLSMREIRNRISQYASYGTAQDDDPVSGWQEKGIVGHDGNGKRHSGNGQGNGSGKGHNGGGQGNGNGHRSGWN